jgi:hypothetical protein
LLFYKCYDPKTHNISRDVLFFEDEVYYQSNNQHKDASQINEQLTIMFLSNFIFPQERIQEQGEGVVKNYSENMIIIQDNEGSEVHEGLNQESTRIEEVTLRRSNR